MQDDPQALPDALPPRYREVTLLGAGAFGRVYRAIDPDGRPAAVKVLAAELAAQPESAWQFASEHRRLARLAHPAFPRALEEGRTPSGQPFYAMALVEGAPPATAVPAERVKVVLAALADALAYLHGLGLVHGDLKPDNMREDGSGRLYVLDVGLMTPVGAPREAVSGTLEYLAPEVLRKAAVATPSDMYALGALGVELWTGRPPFEGGPAALIRAHLQAVPRVAEGAPDADAALEALLEALLAKDPADRPGAHAVLTALGREVDPALLAGAPAGLRGGELVAREAALAAFQQALAAAPGRLFVAAPYGGGKSRLLDECRLQAQLAGWRWVGAACAGAGDVPAGPLKAIVAQAIALSGHPAGPIVEAWLGGRVSAALQELELPARAAAVAQAVGEALTAMATGLGGLVIGLDDWQAADGASRELLAALGRAAHAAPIVWLLAGEPGFHEGPVLDLAPLSPEQATALVASKLGEAPPPGLVEDLMRLAGGTPLLLEHLLDYDVSVGALSPSPAGWRYDATRQRRLGDGAPSDTLKALFDARLAPLPPEALHLAGWAAAGHPAGDLPTGLLVAESGVAPAALDALLAAGLLIEAHGRCRLATPALVGRLLDRLAAADIPARRARLAAMLVQGVAPAELATDTLFKAARLAVQSDDAPLVASLAAEAGRRSLNLGTPDEALIYLEAASAALPDDADAPTRLAIVLPRAEAERMRDRLEEALTHYELAERLADEASDEAAAARAAIGLAKVRQLRGDYPGALTALERAAELAERAGDAAQWARALVSEARLRALKGESALAMARCERAAAIARAAGATSLLAQALNLQGYLLIHADLKHAVSALAMLDEAIALSSAIGDRVGLGLALDNLGNAHLALGDLAAASDAFARYAENCRAIGAETELIAANLNQAIVAAERGEVAPALALAEGVIARATKAGRKFLIGAAKAALGQALWRGDRAGEALAPLDEALELALEIKSLLLEEHVRTYRLEALIARGELEAATSELAAAGRLNAASGNAEMAERQAMLRGDLARLQGDATSAHAHLAPLLDSPNRLAAHRGHQVLAMVALDAGDLARAHDHAASALVIAEAWNAPWHLEADRRLLAQAVGYAPAPAPASGLTISPAEFLAHIEALAAAEGEIAISRAALAGAMALCRAERGYVISYEGGRLRQAVASGLDYAAEVAEGFSQSIVEQVLFSQEPLYVTDASTDEAWSQAKSVMALQLKTVIALPLATPARILGVLYMDRRSLDPLLGEADLALLHAFATAAASAVVRERARAEQELAAAIASGLGAQLAHQLPIGAARREVLLAAIEASDAERGFWLLPEADAWQVALGLDREGRAAPYSDVSRGVIDAVAGSGEPLGILDLGAAEGWQARQSIQALGLRTVWCLPAGTPDGALIYLDTTAMASADPALALDGLEALLRHAAPLLP